MARAEDLAQELTEQLRGLEDKAIARIGRVWTNALRDTIRKVEGLLDGFANQPEYDPDVTPGAFLGSTPDGPVPISPTEKNLAAIGLEGQLIQELRAVLSQFPLSPRQQATIDSELEGLFDQAQALGTEYALELSRAHLGPALEGVVAPPERPPDPWPDREYREGQRFTRLFDLAGSVAAAQRDFQSLSENYRRQAAATTSEHVAASKSYYAKWWNHWGESVSFEVARQMAAGPDPRKVKQALVARIPTINEAFRNRAETIARTETLMASGEAQERCYRRLRVGFVQYMATLDDRTCEWCAPRMGCLYWLGSVKAPIHPNCVLPDTPVLPGQLVTAQRVRYRGPIVTIRTALGHRLSCTENHLVATSRGWVPAHAIQVGDQVLSQPGGHQGALATDPDLNHPPATIQEVFEAALAVSGVPPVGVPVAPMHLHGDGQHGQGQVEVVTPDGQLMDWLEACLTQQPGDLELVAGYAMASPVAGLRPLDQTLFGIHAALSGLMGSGDLALPLLRGHLSPLQQLRFLTRAWRDPRFAEPKLNHRPGDPELLSQAIDAGAGFVGLDQVCGVDVDSSGHEREVYDLTTLSGSYIAGGILTHNCRCMTTPVTLEGFAIENALAKRPTDTWEARAQQAAASTIEKFMAATSGKGKLRPVGGAGDERAGDRDFPLMERTQLPQTLRRRQLADDDPLNQAAADWPSGAPVWCPRRGWLDPVARQAYEQIQAEVRSL